ncbi:MAG: phosphoethanolamine transferase [Bacteroidales bacterium]|nr:phosphoethanolamine transferase [Bacteroidales bacterium]
MAWIEANSWVRAVLVALTLWAVGYTIYRLFNKGIAPNAKLQQFSRYGVASILSSVPIGVCNIDPIQLPVAVIGIVSLLWMVTYPLTFHLTNRKSSPDYDHQMDVAFGIYTFGYLTGLYILLPRLSVVWAIVVAVLVIVAMVQWIYYFTCSNCLDASGMKMLQETHYNEIIEFLKSYSPVAVVMIFILSVGGVGALVWVASSEIEMTVMFTWWGLLITAAVTLFILVYVFKKHHGVFMRTGICELYSQVKEYVENNNKYVSNMEQRIAKLAVRRRAEVETPHTILLVIGESASRDFMSAYHSDLVEDTTPWLRAMAADREHCVLFPNAYSCDIQTVPVLEKALTEYNQYDGGQFYTSCSIVDIAHKLGYRVHWYSNQGHLGAADTPITLVAETSEVAKWTKQELGKAQYDETLIDFLDEVDPTKNNLVVLHLKGSHFNYENRFKETTRQWGEPGSHEQIVNYKNTLYYTDQYLLKPAYEYAKKKLNLQAMVYFSDHADVPDRHRQPNFGNFRDTHIPLMIWMSDKYKAACPEVFRAIEKNRERYWTNDLAYELVCGVLDIESENYKEENSIASEKYKYDKGDLTAMSGRIKIADDPGERGW